MLILNVMTRERQRGLALVLVPADLERLQNGTALRVFCPTHAPQALQHTVIDLLFRPSEAAAAAELEACDFDGPDDPPSLPPPDTLERAVSRRRRTAGPTRRGKER